LKQSSRDTGILAPPETSTLTTVGSGSDDRRVLLLDTGQRLVVQYTVLRLVIPVTHALDVILCPAILHAVDVAYVLLDKALPEVDRELSLTMGGK
jgi:hypothetical protein